MAELVYSILCGKVTLEPSGLFNMQEIIEEVAFFHIGEPNEKLPDVLPRPATLVIQFVRSERNKPEKDVKCKIGFYGPSGKGLLDEREFDIDLISKPGARLFLEFHGLPIPEGSGTYKFTVRLKSGKSGNWKKAAVYPLTIDMRSSEPIVSDASVGKKASAKKPKAKNRKTSSKKKAVQRKKRN